MVALSKSNARTYGVDWLATGRPHMPEDVINERADRLAHAWAE